MRDHACISAFPLNVALVVSGPCFVDFDENGRDEAQECLVIMEDADLDSPAFEFLLHSALDGVGGAQAPTVMLWQGEDGEPISVQIRLASLRLPPR